ncbi:MAG: ABC transporter substrate-binding protein [Gemmatimonadaceae bacterium]
MHQRRADASREQAKMALPRLLRRTRLAAHILAMMHSPSLRALRSTLIILVPLVAACARSNGGRDDRSLVAALDSDPGHLNPAITTNGGVHTASALLYNGLLTLDDSLTPRPELAERWEVEDGGARYRFHLRHDVRWHDGKPFTAGDVKFTFDSVLLKFHARTRASVAPSLLRIDAPDDTTVVFQFRRPYAPLLQQLDVVEAPILPRHVFAGTDPLKNPANVAPIGTGPFRFVSYRTGSEIRYAANDDYFAGAPAIRDLALRVIPDASTQVIALEAGEVDWLFNAPGPDRERLARNPRVQFLYTTVSPGGSNCLTTLGFNLDRPWFKDVRVRRAVAHALNRQQFVERVLFGSGRVATAPISSGIAFAHADDLQLPVYDTARAARLLEAAGWRRTDDDVRVAHAVLGIADGTRFVVGFKALPGQMTYGELLRAQLRMVGIDLRLEPLEQAVFVNVVFTARDFDTAIASYCNGMDPEIGVRRQYVSSSIAPVPFSNMAGYRNATMDGLFDSAGSALDMTERRKVYHQIQEQALRDQPYVWLVETVNVRAYTTRCHGYRRTAHFAASAECTH